MSDEELEQTEALIRAMQTVSINLPTSMVQLAQGTMTVERQKELGDLLIDLGAVIKEHAEQVKQTPRLVMSARSPSDELRM